MIEKHLDFEISAPYCTLNRLRSTTKKIWLVFHGYGMLSRYFINKFRILDKRYNFVIAPQGLSRFYLEGFTGRVGSSWMTKEDRLTEIENQQRYLRAIIDREIITNNFEELIILGFSQGAATASRFAAFSGIDFSKLIIWSGKFPEDIAREDVAHWSDDLVIRYFTGTKDPFLKEVKIPDQHEVIKRLTGIEIEKTEFDGEHELIPDLLLTI